MDRNETVSSNRLLPAGPRKKVQKAVEMKTRPFAELMVFYKCALMEVETKFNVLSQELSLEYDRNPIETIKSRIKSPQSIIEKMERKSLPPTPENIEEYLHDVAGLRVICSFPSDIYTIARAFLLQDDIRLIEKKDYIEHPKENGYRSLHLIVEIPIFLHDEKKYMKVEVQFRTIAMDWWASLEHKIRYKKEVSDTAQIRQELQECAEQAALLDLRMERLRWYLDPEGHQSLMPDFRKPDSES